MLLDIQVTADTAKLVKRSQDLLLHRLSEAKDEIFYFLVQFYRD